MLRPKAHNAAASAATQEIKKAPPLPPKPSTKPKTWAFRKEPVQNLYQFPGEAARNPRPANKTNQITKGDVHANLINLIHFLYTERVIELDEKTYTKLVELYKTPVEKIDSDHLNAFGEIIAIIFNKTNPVGTVRLIGDLLRDRGENDLYILLVIYGLCFNKIPLEILVSNHDIDFLFWFAGFIKAIRADQTLPMNLYQSNKNFEALLKKDLLNIPQIKELVEKYYLPNLKAISYTVDKTSQPHKVSIFTHAPCGLETIKALAALYNITYLDKTSDELCQTIDKINAAFLASIEDGSFFDEYKRESIAFAMFSDGPIPSEFPLMRLVWNRRSHKDNLSYTDPELTTENLPALHNTYFMHFVHGHDGPKALNNVLNVSWANHVFNLDSYLGHSFVEGRPELKLEVNYSAYCSEDEPAKAEKKATVSINSEAAHKANAGDTVAMDSKPAGSTKSATSTLNYNFTLAPKSAIWASCTHKGVEVVRDDKDSIDFEVPIHKRSRPALVIIQGILLKHRVQYFECSDNHVTVYRQTNSKLYNGQEKSAVFWRKIQNEIDAAVEKQGIILCNHPDVLRQHGFNDNDIRKVDILEPSLAPTVVIDEKQATRAHISPKLISKKDAVLVSYKKQVAQAITVYNHSEFLQAIAELAGESHLPYGNQNLVKNIKNLLAECLEQAAVCFAILRDTLGGNRKFPPHNLTPALYLYFFKPIMHALRQNPNADIKACVDKAALIKNIMLCNCRIDPNQDPANNPEIVAYVNAIYNKFGNMKAEVILEEKAKLRAAKQPQAAQQHPAAAVNPAAKPSVFNEIAARTQKAPPIKSNAGTVRAPTYS